RAWRPPAFSPAVTPDWARCPAPASCPATRPTRPRWPTCSGIAGGSSPLSRSPSTSNWSGSSRGPPAASSCTASLTAVTRPAMTSTRSAPPDRVPGRTNQRLTPTDRVLLAVDRAVRGLGGPGFETQTLVYLAGRVDVAGLRRGLERFGARYPIATARLA